jgi:epoxide hydrolase-like predicted phosphatase
MLRGRGQRDPGRRLGGRRSLGRWSLSARLRARARARKGLLVDWGGVLTSSPFQSFRAFCAAEQIDPDALAAIFRANPRGRELLIALEEGRLAETEFELALGALLSVAEPAGLIDRLFAGTLLDEAMLDAVRAARAAGVRTGLVSNSWGAHRYPRELLAELFDGLVISGEVGVRKPATRIYELGAQAIGLAPEECVFVDDLPFNLPPAERLGMATIRHTDAAETIARLEPMLELSLASEERPR